jgi:hypothetical protein
MGQAKARKAEIEVLKKGEATLPTPDVVHHYFKGVSLYSMFTDGFIATESKRSINRMVRKNTDCVWFTSKDTYPKTALPRISGIPYTDLDSQQRVPISVDHDDLAVYVGGVFRFSLKLDEHKEVKLWKDSAERVIALRIADWARMERIANKVGDNINCYWYSSTDIPLENVTLQQYKGGWVDVLPNLCVSSVTAEQQAIIDSLMAESAEVCKKNGLKLHHV